MDISIPVMDDFEATQEICLYEKQISPACASTILALIRSSNDLNKQAFSSRVNAFWTKLVSLKEARKLLNVERVLGIEVKFIC